MELTAAKQQDLPCIMELIEQAKAFLKESGVDQWQDGYPEQSHIEKDMKNGAGYICVDQGQMVGYLCVDYNGEPAYDGLNGAWLSIQPYVVVHRLALDNRVKGRGLASEVFRLVEEMSRKRGIHSFKIDTDEGNQIMKHLLLKNGFHYCGTINFENSEKIAYEKLI